MIDREKVIKGIHQHCEGSMFDRCGECPYYEIDHEPFVCRDMLLNDLNELLKEQENEEERILKIVWDVLHGCVSTDTVEDQDWVYEQIRNRVHPMY